LPSGGIPPEQTSQKPLVYFAGRFSLTVDGVEMGSFTECSGLSVEIETESLIEGGENQFVHHLPSRMKWPNLTLKRGITNSDELFKWFRECSGDGFAGQGNRLTRRAGAVTLRDAAGNTVRAWGFAGAFPVKWTGPSLAAKSSDVATEELVIAHHGFTSSSG